MLGTALILNRRRWLITQVTRRVRWRWLKLGWAATLSLSLGVTLSGCRDEAVAAPRTVALDQAWELDLGSTLEGFRVVASLGDVSLHLRGARVKAPFNGEVQAAAEGQDCVFFSSPEVPAYLFRFCGIQRPRLGAIAAGQAMGRANYLHFATLRRQPEGTWAIVEPSANVLERALERY